MLGYYKNSTRSIRNTENPKYDPSRSLLDKLRDIEKHGGELGAKPDINSYTCPSEDKVAEFNKIAEPLGLVVVSKHDFGEHDFKAFSHRLADRLGIEIEEETPTTPTEE